MQYRSYSIPVFYAVDDRYTKYLLVSITSLIANTYPGQHYDIYILHQRLNRSNQAQLQQLSTNNVTIHLVSMGKKLTALQKEHNTLRGDYETLTIYFRLFIAEMFPEYQRAIYLDADTCLTDDVAKLYQLDLHDNYVGAVPDTFAQRFQDTIDYVNNIVGVPNKQYYNSGVLLMDLQRLRETNFSEHFLNLLNTYHFDVLAADQDYFNAICQHHIYHLPDSWNALPPANNNQPLLKQPQLVHYNFFDKPWLHRNVPYAAIFWRYAKLTPYYNEFADQLAHDGAKRQARERQIIDGLLKHARQIQASGKGFAMLHQPKKEGVL